MWFRTSNLHLFMMTSSNGNIFRVTGPLCGEFTGPGEFPTQRPVTRSFDVLFDLHLNKRLSKQPWGWWFETPSWSLWRQRNVSHASNTTFMSSIKVINKIPYSGTFCVSIPDKLNCTTFCVSIRSLKMNSTLINDNRASLDIKTVFRGWGFPLWR